MATLKAHVVLCARAPHASCRLWSDKNVAAIPSTATPKHIFFPQGYESIEVRTSPHSEVHDG